MISWDELIKLKHKEIIEKEEAATKLIREKMDKFQQYTPLVTTSTGKDSMVVLDLVRKAFPYAHAIFNNTSLDCADTYRMAKRIENCSILNPNEGFYQYVKSAHMVPSRFARFCCKIFKSGVMVQKLDHEIKYLIFMGMRNSESETRSDYGDEYINPEWGNTTNWQGILPIRTWSDLDVWLYILKNGIEINPEYKKGYSRVGCHIACPFYSKSTWILDEYWYPNMRKRWLDILESDFIQQGKWCVCNCTLEEYKQSAWNGGRFRDNPTEKVIDEFMEYKNISDRSIAMKYFNNKCCKCGKTVKKDEVGLSMKYFGRQNENMMCWKCLSKELNKSKKDLKDDVDRFKSQGCTLF